MCGKYYANARTLGNHECKLGDEGVDAGIRIFKVNPDDHSQMVSIRP